MRKIGSSIPSALFSLADRPVPLLRAEWLLAALAAAGLADAFLLQATGLHIALDWPFFSFVIVGLAAVAILVACRAETTRAHQIARDFTEGLSLFAGISLLGAVASYPLAAGRHGLVDPELERIDSSLHFHWIDWYQVVAGHPLLQAAERAAYLSIFVTPAILIGYFALTRRKAESRLFIATFWVAALVTLALFPLLPAAGPLATLWHGDPPYMPVSALYQDQVIHALRHHMLHTVDLGGLRGLVCAPSFHAASATLYAVTAWRVAPLRWPLVALNLGMLLATPVEGTHYLIDLLSGIAVALFAIGVTPTLIELTERPSSARGALVENPS